MSTIGLQIDDKHMTTTPYGRTCCASRREYYLIVPYDRHSDYKKVVGTILVLSSCHIILSIPKLALLLCRRFYLPLLAVFHMSICSPFLAAQGQHPILAGTRHLASLPELSPSSQRNQDNSSCNTRLALPAKVGGVRISRLKPTHALNNSSHSTQHTARRRTVIPFRSFHGSLRSFPAGT